MSDILNEKRIAILATHGFEQSELEKPLRALEEVGADVRVISLDGKPIKGWKDKNWGESVNADLALDEVDAADFDALMLPGGVMNPDTLKTCSRAVQFVRDFFDAGKPVAAICHGPWIFIDAEVTEGRKLTSHPSLKNDLIKAGANWVDEEVVVDQGLVTSRKPSDIPAFNKKMIEEFAQGIHEQQRPVEHKNTYSARTIR